MKVEALRAALARGLRPVEAAWSDPTHLPRAVGRLRTRLGRVKDLLRGEEAPALGPAGIAIETTVRCDLRCPMCPRTGGGYPDADLPDHQLYPLLSDFARLGGDYVYLNGLGEPFLDPRLFDILQHCQALDLQTLVSTHGGHLDASRRSRLLSVGCDVLTVSIDAATEQTYRRVRVGGDFARVRAQVLALAAEKRAQNSPLHLSIQLVIMDANRHEVQAFTEYWRSVPGVDSVRLKDEEFGLPHIAQYDPRDIRPTTPCRILWRGPLLVRYSGDVYSCFPMTYDARPLGNLQTDSFQTLWEGEAMQTLRHLHATGQSGQDASCARCPVVRPHLPFVLGAMAVRGATAQKLIPVAEAWAYRGWLPFAEDRGRKRRP